MFGKLWRGIVLFAVILRGAHWFLTGIFLAFVCHRLKKPPGVPSWELLITLLLLFGIASLLLAVYLSRRWNQLFWTRFSLLSMLCAITAICVVTFLLARPASVLSRTLEPNTSNPRVARYKIKSPGWPTMGPHRLNIHQRIDTPNADINEVDRLALEEAFRMYYGTDERVTLDFLRGVVIILLSLYGCEAIIHATKTIRNRGHCA